MLRPRWLFGVVRWGCALVLATYGDLAGLLLDRGVCGVAPGPVRTVVGVPAEVLKKDAVRLRNVELPARERTGETG